MLAPNFSCPTQRRLVCALLKLDLVLFEIMRMCARARVAYCSAI